MSLPTWFNLENAPWFRSGRGLSWWGAVMLAAAGLGCRTAERPASSAGVTSAAPVTAAAVSERSVGGPALRVKGFIYERAPFPSAHASTVADTPQGIVAAWFGGSDEGNDDVGIWLARWTAGGWSTPRLVAEGLEPGQSTRYPCWNPVLVQMPLGPLVLFYKVGPNPRAWWGMRMESTTGGRTWSRPERLPEGVLGPVRNKPLLLPDSSLLCGSSTEDQGWRVHLERTPDAGAHWSRTPPLNDPDQCGLIQPTLIGWPTGRIQMLCRSRQGFIYESWMGASYEVWSEPAAIGLPNPNSGIDAVMLRDGRALLVYNHTGKGRSPLNVALSRDGRTWTSSVVLEDEPGEYSYPAVIQAADGLVHITYTWKRQRIRHVILEPRNL